MKTYILVILLILVCISPAMGEVSQNKHKNPIITDLGLGLKQAVFIHYAEEEISEETAGLENAACYGYLTGDPILFVKRPIAYVINPRNTQKLKQSFIGSAITAAAETWDTETSPELFANTVTYNSKVKIGRYDGVNALGFGNYPDPSVIAIATVWYYPGALLEVDVLFDSDFRWGDATLDPRKMDLQNIATHELGHGIGLTDQYDPTCEAVTMYGGSWEGDVGKRTLEPPDIVGLESLYGI